MRSVIASVLLTLPASFRDRTALQLEILALRHQLNVVNRSRPQRLRLTRTDRLLWVWLSCVWEGWRDAIVIVKPETVLAWHRRGLRLFWTWKSRRRLGRPAVPQEVRQLIRTMAEANPLWGAPRIHGELLKLGLNISQATVAKYIPGTDVRPPRHGVPFSRIMSVTSWRLISSSCRRPRVDSCSCWSSWHMNDAASCTWPSRPIPRRHGPPNNSARRFRGTRSLAISSAIETAPSRESDPRRREWGSTKYSPRHVHRGRTHMRSV